MEGSTGRQLSTVTSGEGNSGPVDQLTDEERESREREFDIAVFGSTEAALLAGMKIAFDKIFAK